MTKRVVFVASDRQDITSLGFDFQPVNGFTEMAGTMMSFDFPRFGFQVLSLVIKNGMRERVLTTASFWASDSPEGCLVVKKQQQ